MAADEPDPREQEERPRPRVVDKRVAARAEGPPPKPPTEAPPPESPPADATPPAEAAGGSAPAGAEDPLWTPEREAETEALITALVETPSIEWVANTAVTLINVAAAKLERGAASDAGPAIDALAAILDALGPRLGGAESALRRTLAELQLAFAQATMSTPKTE